MNTISGGRQAATDPLAQKTALQAQLERLLAGLSEHGTFHLAEAETDLSQTGALLQEAITVLSESFVNLHAAVAAQQEQLAALMGLQQKCASETMRLQELSDAVGCHVNTAVTCLQFQDLTNQLIDRAARRMAGLRNILTQASEAAEVLRTGDTATARLDHALASVLKISNELDQALLQSVRQKHMKSGEVELF